jgi:hypothetical protein
LCSGFGARSDAKRVAFGVASDAFWGYDCDMHTDLTSHSGMRHTEPTSESAQQVDAQEPMNFGDKLLMLLPKSKAKLPKGHIVWTMRAVAALAKCDRSTVWRWSQGSSPSRTSLHRLCTALNMEVGELFAGTVQEEIAARRLAKQRATRARHAQAMARARAKDQKN